MSSNLVIAKRLLGQYGLFQPGTNGNNNVNGAGAQVPVFPVTGQGQGGNPIPQNQSNVGTPGAAIVNGIYVGQGIKAAYDSGPLFFDECSGWSRIGIMPRAETPGQAWNGLSATVYGTYDWDTASGALTTYSVTTGLRTSGNENWFQIPVPAVESAGDVATWKNPLIAAGDAFWINSNGMLAIRISMGTLVSGAVLFSIVWEP